jgi:Kdo2-lipid IVA lauroyltransferase/acyltransferase
MFLSIRRRIEYFFARLLSLVLYLIPFSVAARMGIGLGTLWFYVHKSRREIAIENLTIAFGHEKDINEIKNIAKKSFQNLGLMLVEFFALKKYGRKWFENNMEFIGYEEPKKEYDKGKGILLLTAHFGNWEVMGAMTALKGVPLNVVARPLDNPFLDRMINDLRGFFGNRVISKHKAIREILKLLKNCEPVAILLDQNTSPLEGIFVDFFGRPACTTPSLAILALRTGFPVFPGFSVRKAPGVHQIISGEQIELDVSGDMKRDVEVNTAKFTKIIESYVRKYPEQWLWVHRRWKTQEK